MNGFKQARREMSPAPVEAYRLSEQRFVIRETVFETQADSRDAETDFWEAIAVHDR